MPNSPFGFQLKDGRWRGFFRCSGTFEADRATPIVVRADLGADFASEGATGTFVLHDVWANRMVVLNRARAERRFRPASTFKIANSLIALETGAEKDENEIIPYGGKPQPVKAWEHDMSMRDAIRISNVAIFQEIARRIGLERMTANVERLNYGNREVGRVVDVFWLDGPLEISAVEQARFVARLAQQGLPMSKRRQSIVRGILRVQTKGDASLFAKTGWAPRVTPQIGWWTGWIEGDGKVYAFALNMDVAGEKDLPKRITIAESIMSRMGIW